MAERLRLARESQGFDSARSAALANNWTPSTYAAHENGQNGIPPKVAKKYAEAFRVSAGWLLTGEGAGPPRIPGLRYVRIVGDVQGGVWRESNEWPRDDQRTIAVSDDPALRQLRLFALEVRGSSMDRLFQEGSTVVCAQVTSTQGGLIAGKRYVVERERPDGLRETTLKTVSRDSEGKYWLVPESNDPRFSQAIPVEGDEGDTIRVIGRVVYSVRPE